MVSYKLFGMILIFRKHDATHLLTCLLLFTFAYLFLVNQYHFQLDFGTIRQSFGTLLEENFANSINDIDQDTFVLTSLSFFIYIIAYIARHDSMRKSISQYAIEWVR